MSHSFGRPPATEQPETSRGEASVTQREWLGAMDAAVDGTDAVISVIIYLVEGISNMFWNLMECVVFSCLNKSVL